MTTNPQALYERMTAAGYDQHVHNLARAVLRGRDVPARTEALTDLLDYLGVLGVTK